MLLTTEGQWITEQERRERMLAGMIDEIISESQLDEEWVTLKDGRRINVGGSAGKEKVVGRVAAKASKVASKIPSRAVATKLAKAGETVWKNMKSDEVLVNKAETAKGAKRILLKHAVMAKRVGELWEAWDGFREFAASFKQATKILLAAATSLVTGHAYAHNAVSALHHAALVIHPLILHAATLAH